jgi:hypothetical protein
MNTNKARNIIDLLEIHFFSPNLRNALKEELKLMNLFEETLKNTSKNFIVCYKYKQNVKLPYTEELRLSSGGWCVLDTETLIDKKKEISLHTPRPISYIIGNIPFLDEIKKIKNDIRYLEYKNNPKYVYMKDLDRKYKYKNPMYLDELKEGFYLYETNVSPKPKKISYVLYDYPFLDEIKNQHKSIFESIIKYLRM